MLACFIAVKMCRNQQTRATTSNLILNTVFNVESFSYELRNRDLFYKLHWMQPVSFVRLLNTGGIHNKLRRNAAKRPNGQVVTPLMRLSTFLRYLAGSRVAEIRSFFVWRSRLLTFAARSSTGILYHFIVLAWYCLHGLKVFVNTYRCKLTSFLLYIT